MSFSAFVATPQAFIECYPFEGGMFTITGQQSSLLGLSVTMNIGGSPGQFSMQLAPGGPSGPNASPSWADVLTPMSLVVIGISRMGRSQIVMVGIVVSVRESTTWVTERGVQRSILIQGADFGYIFQNQLFYLQTYLIFSNLSGFPVPGVVGTFGSGLLEGAPDAVAAAWYNEVMAGSKGVVSDLSFAYQHGARVTFSQLMSTFFETYPNPVRIPYSSNFLSSDGNWMSKFQAILPAPWYETFVSTSPINFYNTGTASSSTTGIGISMASLPAAVPVTPVLVGRVNPLPFLEFTAGQSLPTSLDMTRWDALPISAPDTGSYISSDVSLDCGDVRNFYILNPVGISNQFGGSNNQNTPFMFSHACYLDSSSIHRYGLRPLVGEVEWFSDPSGGQAQQNAAAGNGGQEFDDLVSALALKQVSYYEPTALMRRASVVDFLRPDILPGTRYVYPPHKDGVPWMFYIEAVTHQFNFGGYSTTTMSLSRGLPQDTYNDTSVLLAIHLGNAQILNGQYVAGLPPGIGGSGIEVVDAISIQNGILGQVAAIFNTPQGGG